MEAKKHIDWNVKIEKPEYKSGEVVAIIGVFTPGEKEAGVWRVNTQFIQHQAYDFPSTIVPYSVQLEPGKKREETVARLPVNDNLPPGEYSAKVGLEMARGVMDVKEVRFKIVGTPKPFDFRVALSRDKDAKKPAKIFTSADKEVYIKVICDVPGITFTGRFKSPPGKEADLAFKGMVSSFALTGEGAYRLSVTARAEGYRTVTKQVDFSVIRENPVFKKISDTDEDLSVRK